MENYTKIESEIGKIVENFTQNWMQNHAGESEKSTEKTISYEQVFTVYRILIIPEELIRKYLCLLEKSYLKKECRKYALLLHPDKNGHPDAKKAFQKIYGIITSILKSPTWPGF